MFFIKVELSKHRLFTLSKETEPKLLLSGLPIPYRTGGSEFDSTRACNFFLILALLH
jgi:hypothetical protein